MKNQVTNQLDNITNYKFSGCKVRNEYSGDLLGLGATSGYFEVYRTFAQTPYADNIEVCFANDSSKITVIQVGLFLQTLIIAKRLPALIIAQSILPLLFIRVHCKRRIPVFVSSKSFIFPQSFVSCLFSVN